MPKTIYDNAEGLEEILKPFGLIPGGTETLFADKFIKVVSQIRRTYLTLNFDHRPFFLDYALKKNIFSKGLMTEEFRRGYACFKYAVSRVIGPKSIFEIGVGSGVSALAFIMASPDSKYMGLDNGWLDKHEEFSFIDGITKRFSEMGIPAEILRQDSQDLTRLPGDFDFVHVNGGHSRKEVSHDVSVAWESGATWILLDDTRDTSVISGFADSLEKVVKGVLDWSYFEDTWTGNILLHRRYDQ